MTAAATGRHQPASGTGERVEHLVRSAGEPGQSVAASAAGHSEQQRDQRGDPVRSVRLTPSAHENILWRDKDDGDSEGHSTRGSDRKLLIECRRNADDLHATIASRHLCNVVELRSSSGADQPEHVSAGRHITSQRA
jgi:hypothetical protein